MEQNFKIAVPEGCTASVEKKDNFVIVTFEPKKWEPKDGDILSDKVYGNIFIFRKKEHNDCYCYAGLLYDSSLYIDPVDFWTSRLKEYGPATEEEKQRLFDALAKKGKRWNAEEKRIEDLPRWRACNGTDYYYINQIGSVRADTEALVECDDVRYESCNYFKTWEAAEKVACQIREIFKNSKAE